MRKRKPRSRRSSCLRRFINLIVGGAIALLLLSILFVLPWRWLPLPTSSFMLQSYFLADPDSRQPYQYHWIDYGLISSYLPLAAVAAEDQRFPEHHGFDFEAIQQALEDHQEGEGLRGASTISQQVAKNIYLWPGQTLGRKGLEAWLTVLIELLWSKQRILEVYVNIAQFGRHVFGAEAASETFFDKPASDLTREDAALLAAVLPGPELYQVDHPSGEVYQRQDWILRQMEQLGDDYLQAIETHN